MPPTLIAGTQGKHLHYQLKSHPLHSAIDRAICWLSDYTDICCDLGGADSAAGNEKMVAHWLNTLEEQIKTFTADNDTTSLFNDRKVAVQLFDWCRCHSHQTFLLQSGTLLMFRSDFPSRAYGMSSFLRTGSYWIRLIIAFTLWCTNAKRIQATPENIVLSMPVQQLMCYMSTWGTYSSSKTSSSDALRSDYESYFNLVPTALSQKPVRVCDLLSETQEETYHLLQTRGMVFFRTKPSSPDTNKWTKQWTSFDFVGQGILVGRFLGDCWRLAYAAIPFDKFSNEISSSFNAVSGDRMRNFQKFIDSQDANFTFLVFLVCTEPTRCLTVFWLHLLNAKKKTSTEDVPESMNLVHPQMSILTAFH